MTNAPNSRPGQSFARRTLMTIVAGLGLLVASACGASDSDSTTTPAGGVASSIAAAASSAKAAAGSALSSVKAEAGPALSSAKAEAGSALSSAKAEASSALSSAKAEAGSAVSSVVSRASAAGADSVSGVYTGTGPNGADWTLTFAAGQLTAKGDCNTMSGAVEMSTEVLKVEKLASTLMACDEAKMAQDTAISDFLSANPVWVLDGDSLVLTNGATTYLLTKQG